MAIGTWLFEDHPVSFGSRADRDDSQEPLEKSVASQYRQCHRRFWLFDYSIRRLWICWMVSIKQRSPYRDKWNDKDRKLNVPKDFHQSENCQLFFSLTENECPQISIISWWIGIHVLSWFSFKIYMIWGHTLFCSYYSHKWDKWSANRRVKNHYVFLSLNIRLPGGRRPCASFVRLFFAKMLSYFTKHQRKVIRKKTSLVPETQKVCINLDAAFTSCMQSRCKNCFSTKTGIFVPNVHKVIFLRGFHRNFFPVSSRTLSSQGLSSFVYTKWKHSKAIQVSFFFQRVSIWAIEVFILKSSQSSENRRWKQIENLE